MSATHRVIGAEHVARAGRLGKREIEVSPDGIVTAQALDSAARLRVTLRRGPLDRPAIPVPDGATTLRRVLYRRSPRWVSPQPRSGRDPTRFQRIAIVGTGGVGTSLAHLVANGNVADTLALIDLVPGRAESIALDLNHAAGLTRTASHATGGTDLSAIADAEVVVITAGRARTPGMSRTELANANRRIVHMIATSLRTAAPHATVVVVTNPVEDMTQEVLQVTEFPRNRVIGMAGTLDSARLRESIARVAQVSIADVEAVVLGCHGDEMVPVVSRAQIRGRPVTHLLNAEQIEQCKIETVTAGGQVVALRRTGSAYLAPAHAVLEILEHMRGGRVGTIPVTVQLSGEYGLGEAILGVPANLGPRGVIDVVELPLIESETQALHAAAQAISHRLTHRTNG